jgi:NhaP-type Na+/H+ or K+/H+ antiporter
MMVCLKAGVIATVCCGLTVKFMSRAMINESGLLEDFWILLEHMLNTVLFTLGGVVWGEVIADGEKKGLIRAREWGYLLLLYVLLTVIRAVLFVVVYPLSVRLGLKTNVKEQIFQVYGGLRGAVGISLAIALDSSVRQNAEEGSVFLEQTNLVFFMIGGVAFLTLVINGTTAGPLLIWLGLAETTDARKRIVDAYRAGFKQHLILRFVTLLSEDRFRNVNFGLVKSHVPYLEDITSFQLLDAIERHKDTTLSQDYQSPYLQGVLPYLTFESEESAVGNQNTETLLQELQKDAKSRLRFSRATNRATRRRRKSNVSYLMSGEPLSTQEMRTLFISLLAGCYERQIDHGELAAREFLAVALQQSLDFARDQIANGGKLEGRSSKGLSGTACFHMGLTHFFPGRLEVRTCSRRSRFRHYQPPQGQPLRDKCDRKLLQRRISKQREVHHKKVGNRALHVLHGCTQVSAIVHCTRI